MKIKTVYKQTEIGEIPEDWEVKTTGELFYIKGRIGWRGLKKSHFTTDGPYLITGVDFKNGKIDWNNCFHIPTDKFLESPEIIVQKDDILLTKDGTIGKVAHINEIPGGKASINAHILLIRNSENNGVYPRYVYYVLQSYRFFAYAIRNQTGTTRAGLPQRIFEKFTIPLPPYIEQQKIADVLSTADYTIQKTNEIIQTTQLLKNGLMQQLLTSGIGHTKFKQTEIGKIPEDWEVKKIEEFCEVRTGGTPSMKHPEYYNGEIKWLRSGDIHGKRIYDVDGRITEEGLKNSNAKILPTNSIMIALNGRGRTRGTVAILKTEAACNQSLAAIIIKNETDPEYLLYHLESKYDELRRLTGDNDRTGLNLRIINNLSVVIPPRSEQQKITDILFAIDKKIEFETTRKIKFEQLKQGLMNDLLTGKKRLN